jgi:hypothetical protein
MKNPSPLLPYRPANSMNLVVAVGRDIGKDKTAIFFHLVYGLLLLSLLFWSCSFSYSCSFMRLQLQKEEHKEEEELMSLVFISLAS